MRRPCERWSASLRLCSRGNHYDSFKEQITDRVLQTQVSKWTQLTKNANEDTDAFLTRILDEIQAKGDYAKLLEVLKFASQANRDQEKTSTISSRAGPSINTSRPNALKGLEDNLAGYTNYRLVVAAPTNKYTPTKEAEAALKTLQEKDPAAFKSYEGVLLEEIRFACTDADDPRPGARPPVLPGFPPTMGKNAWKLFVWLLVFVACREVRAEEGAQKDAYAHWPPGWVSAYERFAAFHRRAKKDVSRESTCRSSQPVRFFIPYGYSRPRPSI